MNAATTVTRKIASCRRQATRVRALLLLCWASSGAPGRARCGVHQQVLWTVAPRWLSHRSPCVAPACPEAPRPGSVRCRGCFPLASLLRIVRCPQARKGTTAQGSSQRQRPALLASARHATVLSSRDLPRRQSCSAVAPARPSQLSPRRAAATRASSRPCTLVDWRGPLRGPSRDRSIDQNDLVGLRWPPRAMAEPK